MGGGFMATRNVEKKEREKIIDTINTGH